MYQVFIILAHKNPEQLRRLIKSLNYTSVKFVVHVDLSVSLDTFSKSISKDFKNVTFLTERYEVKWGSYEMIKATISSLRFVHVNVKGVERVTLLSGQDYPIKPLQNILHYFSVNKDLIFIEYFPLPSRRWPGGGIGRFPDYTNISKIWKIYSGSQWWSFPVGVVEEVLSIIDASPEFINYFKAVLVPDESFFQTLLLNFGSNITLKRLVNDSKRLIKWHPPYIHPKTFSSKDLDQLIRSKKLFARKFDESVDHHILEKIDYYLLSSNRRKLYCKKINTRLPVYNQALLMLTDKVASVPKFKKLKLELSEHFKAILLFHNKDNKHKVETELTSEETFFFDDSILTNSGFTPIAKNILPGSNHFPLLTYYEENPHFDYYWVIEDDVFYNGDWMNFFVEFHPSRIQSDFISCHLRFFLQDSNWHWWNSLDLPPQLKIESPKRVASLNPIYRISNAAIKYLLGQLRQGSKGHHEVLIPTLLYNAGFSILDFGGKGLFSFPSKKEKYYTSSKFSNDGQLLEGSMRYRPKVEYAEIKDKLLYHPVKMISKEEHASNHTLNYDLSERNGSESMMKRSVILFLTNKTSKEVFQEFTQIQKSNDCNISARILFHFSGQSDQTLNSQADKSFVFDNTLRQTLGYIPISKELLPTNTHFPLLAFYLQNEKFDYYWLIEDDVRFNGDWSDFFEFFQHEGGQYDFISSHVKKYHEAPEWYWWNSLHNTKEFVPKQNYIASFNPIFRISRVALKYLHDQLVNGWQGHHEVLIPTLLNHGGFSIADLGGIGEFVPKGWENKFYAASFLDRHCKTIMSSMRYRPNIDKSEIKERLLYHPVKSIKCDHVF